MCFQLYAGSRYPIPRKSWNHDAPDVSVESLKDNEEEIRMHFCKPEVQNIGSTSGCGCDFPWAMFQNDEWPQCDYGEQVNSGRQNIEALARLLKTLKDDSIELYGVWAGDYARPRRFAKISLLRNYWILASFLRSAASTLSVSDSRNANPRRPRSVAANDSGSGFRLPDRCPRSPQSSQQAVNHPSDCAGLVQDSLRLLHCHHLQVPG